MKQTEIKRVLASRFEKINSSWDRITRHFDIEEIHDFRVDIKKLRAFTRLAATQLMGPVQLKMPFHLQSMYRYTGNIRNFQLQQQRVSEFVQEKEISPPQQYLNSLLDKQQELERKVNDVSNEKALETEEVTLIRTLRVKLSEENMRHYCQSRAEELKKLIAFSEYTDERLHQIRKILKDVLYNLSHTGDHFFSFFNLLQSKEELKSFTELLGEFHDSCISLELLLPVDSSEITEPEEIRSLQTIQEEWSQKKSERQRVICETLDRLK